MEQRPALLGLWLGILTREKLYALIEEHYTRSNLTRGPNYHAKEWNHSGLTTWEKTALSNRFGVCRRLLVVGAGGGREVLALAKRGYLVDGFEPNPDLVSVTNELLGEEGTIARFV